MQRQFKKAIAIAVALVLGVMPAFAGEYDPLGRWQTTIGESRFEFSYCGDGTKLCATLVWLNADAMKSPAAKQIGSYAYTLASHIGANTWRGILAYDGRTTLATIRLTTPKTLTVSGCYFIWCRSFNLVKLTR